MEYGETDLKSFLSQHQDKGSSIDMNSVRLLWQQMLESVNTIHQASIIHSDLKPANFLFVRGCLKLIDFGIARSMGPESTERAATVRWGRSTTSLRKPFWTKATGFESLCWAALSVDSPLLRRVVVGVHSLPDGVWRVALPEPTDCAEAGSDHQREAAHRLSQTGVGVAER